MNAFHQIRNRLRDGLGELYEACCSALACLEEGDFPDAAGREPAGRARGGKMARLLRPPQGAAQSGDWIGHAG